MIPSHAISCGKYRLFSSLLLANRLPASRNGITSLLIRLARSTDSSIADRAAAALSSLCGEASKGDRKRSMAIGALNVTLHELSYVQVGVGFKVRSSCHC